MYIIKNIFEKEVTDEVIDRINKLTPQTKPLWGKMTVSQMLAHCSVTYEFLYENIHPKPGAFKRFLIQLFAKGIVVGDKPYKKNIPTAPAFKVANDKDFNAEKKRLISYLVRTQSLGATYFDNKESLSFGKLTIREWNNMFYKHIDHHLTQFGV